MSNNCESIKQLVSFVTSARKQIHLFTEKEWHQFIETVKFLGDSIYLQGSTEARQEILDMYEDDKEL